MEQFEAKLSILKQYIVELNALYINKHLPARPEDTPDIYEHDVKVFFIMSHAALEEFFEEIAKEVLKQCILKYENENKILLPLLTLLSNSSNRFNINIATDNLDIIKERIKKIILDSKTEYYANISKNHGIQISHLKSILYPISLEIEDNAIWINSLKKLCSNRGLFAHTTKTCSIEPESAKNIVEDCIGIANSITEQAKRIFE